MLHLGFLFAGTALNLVLGFLVQLKSYRKSLRLTLFGLSGLFVTHLWVAYFSAFADSPLDWFWYQKILQSLGLFISVACLELVREFLRNRDEEVQKNSGKIASKNTAKPWNKFPITLFQWIIAGAFLGEIFIWMEGNIIPSGDLAAPMVRFSGLGLYVPGFLALVAIYTLYILESTYRFAKPYQRRIARLGFIGLGCLALFHVLYYSYVLLYLVLPLHFLEISSVVYGIVYPIVLIGFLRYRLGSERISIPRDTVYTSATIFLTGAAFLGVALTIFIFKWLHLDFSYFEKFLLAFSLCFLSVLVLGSGTMRKRISRYINDQFYSRKFDYQEQFFRLHKTALSGADVDSALIELVENMKYSVTVDDAYFFILNWQDGNYYQHENKEEATRRGLIISGDSPLSRMLAREGQPVDLLAHDDRGLANRTAAREEPLVYQLKFDAVFPIFLRDRLGENQQGRLAGFLALQGGRDEPFDREDLALIDVFTTSIGDVLFKNQLLNQRIEQKQFESFHHVASFIIHDIKNQIATLNLLLKNAERNIENPAFQASMLTSVNSCATNLQSLIDRLSVAPKGQAVHLVLHSLKSLLQDVISNSGLTSLTHIDFIFHSDDNGLSNSSPQDQGTSAPMDREALFFVVRNLINNALEAIHSKRDKSKKEQIQLSYGSLEKNIPTKLRELFGGGDRFFAAYSAFILVQDSGGGMDKEFVRRKLFQPFATTKEKGVGIGLYQCKTLVEKMGGKILVHSELGTGTEFCILLPLDPHSKNLNSKSSLPN